VSDVDIETYVHQLRVALLAGIAHPNDELRAAVQTLVREIYAGMIKL
jgi:hypothetical protein